MVNTQSSRAAALSAAVFYGLLFSSTTVHCQDATKPKLALTRSYPIQQAPIKAFNNLVAADRARALALGRHQGQTPTEEYYGEEEEPECDEDEEFVRVASGEVAEGTTANLRNAVSFAVAADSVGTDGTDVEM
jgi:hypothetical protein